jgi:hypothetical protein
MDRFGFSFISLKSKKPNWIEPKPKKNESNRQKTEPNRFEPGFVLKNQTEPNWNRSVWTSFGFFLKKFDLTFLYI